MGKYASELVNIFKYPRAFECEDPMRMGRSDSDDESVLRSDECA